jgi:hypothetical protein
MTIFKHKQVESGLDRLEREANDDFLLLEELGPGHFGFEHLIELREKNWEQLQVFQKRQKLAMVVGVCATGWIFLAIFARYLNYPWLTFAAYSAGSLGLIAFLGIVLWQKSNSKAKERLSIPARL